ncbi:MAG: hypothetical protein KDC10_07940 [Calditrichaeota bacterium]|nr:hypothetical protein [Candidatus Cloacimonadota bacterium]MCA9785853.1 hypothetical protein [Candidatus Cloacimonadota bacterium]MCB1047122.1 hypothetical protein [Calditrichota bacterium]MCB9473912.1 hypothetical protein [Candidatus Delongbacteria bacterium]
MSVLRLLLSMLAIFGMGALFAWSLARREAGRAGMACDEGCGGCSHHCHERTEGHG